MINPVECLREVGIDAIIQDFCYLKPGPKIECRIQDLT